MAKYRVFYKKYRIEECVRDLELDAREDMNRGQINEIARKVLEGKISEDIPAGKMGDALEHIVDTSAWIDDVEAFLFDPETFEPLD